MFRFKSLLTKGIQWLLRNLKYQLELPPRQTDNPGLGQQIPILLNEVVRMINSLHFISSHEPHELYNKLMSKNSHELGWKDY